MSAFQNVGRDYRFTSANVPAPFDDARPYVESIKVLPTEIKDTFTVAGRLGVRFLDEPDPDVWSDPYWSTRLSHPGTYWKRLLARNPNYGRRIVKVFEGYAGQTEGQYVQRWIGRIENVKLGKSGVDLEAVDLLKDLSKVTVPEKGNHKLGSDISASLTASLTLNSVSGFGSSGYIRIDDEIIGYSSLNTETRQIVGLTRGAFLTTAAEHKAKAKVQYCRYYAPQDPADLLLEMLQTDAGIATADIDTAAFDLIRGFPGVVNFSALIDEPTKLNILYNEVRELIDCQSWVAEDLKITILRNLPNEPGRNYTALNDEDNIMVRSGSADLNEKSRLTRCSIYWDKIVTQKDGDFASYRRQELSINADCEVAIGYGDQVGATIYCRWIDPNAMQEEDAQQFITSAAGRLIQRRRDALPTIAVNVDLKDEEIKTGDFITLSTDELLQATGDPLALEKWQVVKRDRKEATIALMLQRIGRHRIAFATPAGTPDYTSATDAQKEYGFACGSDGKMSTGDLGYYAY